MNITDTSPDRGAEGVRAVDRALDILLAFRQGEGHVSAAELLQRLELSRPTLYRLLRTLEHRGFITTSGEPRRYQLGPAVGHLAQVWSQDINLVDLLQPAMQGLWERTGETVALMLHRGFERICVAELPSQQPLSFKRGIGHSDSVLVGASGRVILANIPFPENYLDGRIADDQKPAYLKELARIREAGYAVSRDELIKGAVAMAVPVIDSRHQVLGSLAVFGPSARIDDDLVRQYVRWLQDAAAEVKSKLG